MTKNNEVYGLTGGTMVNDAGINENKETVVVGILEDVREQAGKLAERIQEMIEGRDQIEYTDLKLHDVASQVGEEGDDLFTLFCTEQLQVWEERLSDWNLSTRYIGRSSSFYITPDTTNEDEALAPFYNEWQFERDAEDVIDLVNDEMVGYGSEEYEVVRGTMRAIQDGVVYGIDEFMEPYASIYGDKDEFMEEAEELAYYALDFIDELNQALDYVEERLDVVENAYKWLEDYKADQVEVYRDWLVSYEESTTFSNKEHLLKILPEYFNPVRKGIKPFEIRKNDRDFQVGDKLLLKEYVAGSFTGEAVKVTVTYITDYAQHSEYIVMAIELDE